MRMALAEGERGVGLTSPNPPVGAVIVDDDGEVLGKGFHSKAGSAHAEVHAIESVGSKPLQGTSLFVTLEPCSTHGRTPPCCDAIQVAGIKRVFVGITDPNPNHVGAARSILEAQGIFFKSGILEKEAGHLIRFFRKHMETGLPYLIAKTAMTLDGHTTLPRERGQWISSPESREDVQRLRRQCDAILIGGETLRRDDPMLTLRGSYVQGRSQPERIVVTSQKELPQDFKLFNDEFADRTETHHDKPLREVLAELGKREICSVLMESGGRLFTHAIEDGLIDEVVLYLAPIMGGGATRLMPIDDVMADLEDLEVEKIGPDVRIMGRIKK